MSPMLYLHSWSFCLFVLGFSIEPSIHSSSPNLLEFCFFNVVCTFISGDLYVLILSLESRQSGSRALLKLYIYFVCPRDPLVSKQRLMGLSLWGHSFYTILSFFIFPSVITSFPTLYLWHAYGFKVPWPPPAPLSVKVPAQCLPMSLDHKTTFLEGNQIGPASQLPHVKPDIPGQGSRSGED